MALNINCSACLQELSEPGAIILSPPADERVTKFHLCKRCFANLTTLTPNGDRYFLKPILQLTAQEKEILSDNFS